MAYPIYAVALAGVALYFIISRATSYVLAYRFKKAHGCKPERKMPQWDRFIGIGLYRAQRKAFFNQQILATIRARHRKIGPTYSSVIMGMKFYHTSDPENIKALLATSFNDFGVGKRVDVFGVLLGKGIFTTDGAAWEHSRALVRPSFTRTQVADLDTLETHVNHFISKIPKDRSTVDLQPLFFQLTLDSATEFLFGESVNSLGSTEGSDQHRFGTAFDFAQSKVGNRDRLEWLTSMFTGESELERACAFVHAFVDQIVYRTLEKTKSYDSEKPDDFDESGRYVFLTEVAKKTRDPQQLRDESLNILLAGRDTTASLLSHTFHALSRRPDIVKKLKAEVDELGGKKPTYETLRSMKYLKYVLNESLRLYPVVPGNARFSNKMTTLPRGGGPDGNSPIYIPSGAIVTYSVYTMHTRKDIYGPDADEFRPERWAPEEGLQPGWGYLPFNGGPRICVGQQFALTEASYTMVRLLQEFESVESRDATPWTEKIGLTLAIRNGVQVAMVPKV